MTTIQGVAAFIGVAVLGNAIVVSCTSLLISDDYMRGFVNGLFAALIGGVAWPLLKGSEPPEREAT